MKIEWINRQNVTGAITIHPNNITLNKQAANFFNDAYAVAVGIDKDSGDLIIKHVTKEEADKLGDNNLEQLHKLAIKQSYGRITGKQMVDELVSFYHLNFNVHQNYKFPAKWNTGYRMLIVNMKGVE